MPVDGHQLRCVVAGDLTEQPVVLLHSGLGSVAEWETLLPALIGDRRAVLAYDRWGYGGSDFRDEFAPPDFESDVRDLAELVERLGVSRPTLVGHSDGGSIALAYAARAGEAVRGVLAVAAHAYLELKMLPGIRDLEQRFANDAGLRKALVEKHGPHMETTARAWFAGWQRPDAWRWDMREELTAVRCPTLVVQGLDDEYATPEHARDIAGCVAGAELKLLPGVGHMVPQSADADFNELALAFVSSASVRSEAPGSGVAGGALGSSPGGG